ncbi:interferon regulatory factor 3 isoform X2 [Fundulus heteroclitus]|uniref:interferon regulatory factor 3 isoform X2 n=1 Tax=Fundulus heteroclitus TaxID=8078 RepID=UPI00165C6E23|nr:interferon regulatory factor 3 isoform X2 [Fundulus heteroclitus]
MAQSKPLLMPWLKANIDSGRYPGVQWTNAEQTEFCIPWKHALRQDSSNADVLIFKAWAEVSGNGRAQGDPSVWKRNFRSALRAKGFKMVSDQKNDPANPHKIYRWPEGPASGGKSSSGSQEQDDGNTIDNFIAQESKVVPFFEDDGLYNPLDIQMPECPASQDILQECLQGLNIGPEAGSLITSPRRSGSRNQTRARETEFKVSVYYRGTKVLQQLVPNEAGVRLVYRPDLNGTALDHESGLSLVSLPTPEGILDRTQVTLTQRILDSLGNGLDVGMSEGVIYGQRRGEVKAYWSLSKFDNSRSPQEIPKMNPEPLYQAKDFIRGILDFINGMDSPPYALFFCLGEKWPDPENKPWEKKLIMVEVVLTSLELLKNMAVEFGASSLQSVDLQMSLEEMMELY